VIELSDTQLPLQSCVLAGQVLTHCLPSQLTVPPVSVGQGEHALPQVLTSVLLTHCVPHRCVPLGQAHCPFAHISPPEQTLSQLPQWLLSTVVSTQAPLHMVRPRTHVKPQLAPSQVAVAPAGGVHAVHEVVPQLAVEVFDTQLPPHRCWPLGQVHAPASQL